MALGAFAPFPIRLGGSSREGITAAGHARMAADLVAVGRTLPLAVLELTVDSGEAEVLRYYGRNGVGLEHAPTVAGTVNPGEVVITWPRYYESEDGRTIRWLPKFFRATWSGTGPELVSWNPGYSSTLDMVADGTITLSVFGDTEPVSIGDYDGALDKYDDITENPIPYAALVYRDVQMQRGSAYTTKRGTYVDAENVALARFWSLIGYRLPDKLRNNAKPASADEGLAYWSAVLGIPMREREPKGDLRNRLAVHYRASEGATYDSFRQACQDLLGPVFLGITLQHDASLQTPSVTTYWPGVNPAGSDAYDIGGGAWFSERAQVLINLRRPAGYSQSQFDQLANVELFTLVDRMLPAWATAQWRDEGEIAVTWDSTTWDGSVWVDLFDWNA